MKFIKSYNINADIIRILAGIGVVLIHVTDPFIAYPPAMGTRGFSWEVIYLINTFFRSSVPLFIMLSGFFLLQPSKPFDTKEFYRKRLWRVGIPLLFWLAVELIWYISVSVTQPTLFQLFEKVIGVNLGHLYFLVIIVELYYITPYIIILLKNSSLDMHKKLVYNAFGFTLALSAINALSYEADVVTSDSIITIFLPFICYYLVGYYVTMKNFKYAQSFWMVIAYGLLVLITALLSNGDVGAYARQYGSPLIILMVLISFIYLMNNESIRKWGSNKRIVTIIQSTASMIFGVYLTHMLVINILDIVYRIVPETVRSPMWMYVLGKFAVVLCISFVIVVLGKRIPYVKALFG